jgi:hypothetical protein
LMPFKFAARRKPTNLNDLLCGQFGKQRALILVEPS